MEKGQNNDCRFKDGEAETQSLTAAEKVTPQAAGRTEDRVSQSPSPAQHSGLPVHIISTGKSTANWCRMFESGRSCRHGYSIRRLSSAMAGALLFHNSSVVCKHQRNNEHRNSDSFSTCANACHVIQRQNKLLAVTLLHRPSWLVH